VAASNVATDTAKQLRTKHRMAHLLIKGKKGNN
jgi:hypothetical protein